MKRIISINVVQMRLVIILLILCSLVSCSWFSGKRTVLDSSSNTQSVPKSQYDQLLKKYEQAIANKRNGPVKHEAPRIESKESINIEREKDELIETVNLFDKNEIGYKNSLSRKEVGMVHQSYDGMAIENQLLELRKSLKLIGENKVDEAMTKLKQLEKSPVSQVKVRSKFLIAELIFRQGEFDLAMQIYEEIIFKHAFSGVVLKTLGRLIVCCERLKLTKKKDQYNSLLYDFFEVS